MLWRNIWLEIAKDSKYFWKGENHTVNPITASVHKMVKHTKQMLQDF